MAYTEGFLLKVGNDIIPLKYMKFDSFKCTLNSLDLDSYRNANGELVRNAIAKKIKVDFQTPHLYMSEKNALMALINNNYTNVLERKAYIKAYCDELDEYVEGYAYLVDPDFEKQQNSSNGFIYKPTRICFVQY